MLGTYWQLRALVILVLSLFVQFWEQWNINQTSKNKDKCVAPIAWEFAVEKHMSQDIILLKDPQKLFTGYQTLTWWKDVKKKTWCQIWAHLWTARAARGSCRSNIHDTSSSDSATSPVYAWLTLNSSCRAVSNETWRRFQVKLSCSKTKSYRWLLPISCLSWAEIKWLPRGSAIAGVAATRLGTSISRI